MTQDQGWETRHGQQETANVSRVGGQTLDSLPDMLKTLTHTDTDRPQLCIDVHQCRPDPFNPSRCVFFLSLKHLQTTATDSSICNACYVDVLTSLLAIRASSRVRSKYGTLHSVLYVALQRG